MPMNRYNPGSEETGSCDYSRPQEVRLGVPGLSRLVGAGQVNKDLDSQPLIPKQLDLLEKLQEEVLQKLEVLLERLSPVLRIDAEKTTRSGPEPGIPQPWIVNNLESRIYATQLMGDRIRSILDRLEV